MMRSVLGVIAGYLVWTGVFLGGSAGVRSMMSSVHDERGFTSSAAALGIYLVLSVVASLLAGLTTAKIAGPPQVRWVWITAIALLATGVPVQLASWDSLPVWYNLAFLVLLVPATLMGGRMGGAGSETT